MSNLDWGNFDGPKRNTDWKPALQDLIHTAINFRDDEYGDADEDAGQQIVERLLSALRDEIGDKAMFNAHRHELLEKIDNGGWQPIETAPGMTDVLVWWPLVQLDDDGDPTDEVTGGGAFVSELQGNYWIEPDALNATGDHMGDDETYADSPSHWMPLPAAPEANGGVYD